MGKKITPILFKEGRYTERSLAKFKKENLIWEVIDVYASQLNELFEVAFPHLIGTPEFKKKQKQFVKKKSVEESSGDWIYFPWNGSFVHMVSEKDYYTLRTNRNKNLITDSEQDMLNKFSVGIVGLSVGSGIATSLAYQGISNRMTLAEFDSLETTNLNRIRAGVQHLGLAKIEIAARQVYEINPYAKLSLITEGLTEKTLKQFISSKPKLIFEIIDDFEMKIKLRLLARKAQIPVVMMANLGDSVLIDIERFDLDNTLSLFNGVLGNLPEKILENPNEDKNKYAVQIVGLENVPQRAMESVREINKTLVGRPQLSNTVTVGSSLAVYIARCIALGTPLSSGRYKMTFDNVFKKMDNQAK